MRCSSSCSHLTHCPCALVAGHRPLDRALILICGGAVHAGCVWPKCALALAVAHGISARSTPEADSSWLESNAFARARRLGAPSSLVSISFSEFATRVTHLGAGLSPVQKQVSGIGSGAHLANHRKIRGVHHANHSVSLDRHVDLAILVRTLSNCNRVEIYRTQPLSVWAVSPR